MSKLPITEAISDRLDQAINGIISIRTKIHRPLFTLFQAAVTFACVIWFLLFNTGNNILAFWYAVVLFVMVVIFKKRKTDLTEDFIKEINNNDEFVGDVLEFGTGSGTSTLRMRMILWKNKIYTFDGFRGLPKTNKVIPTGSDWVEGQFKYDEQITRDKLKPYNIVVEKCMTWELKTPKEYGISKISGVNIDLDLYEGTLDALNFMDKCEWDNVLLRFDDWGAHGMEWFLFLFRDTKQLKKEIEEHELAAFYDFIHKKGYKYKFYYELNELAKNRYVLIKVSR